VINRLMIVIFGAAVAVTACSSSAPPAPGHTGDGAQAGTGQALSTTAPDGTGSSAHPGMSTGGQAGGRPGSRTSSGGRGSHEPGGGKDTPGPPGPTIPPAPGKPGEGGSPHGNITLSAQGGSLPPGPFKITAMYCGTLTAADQAKYRTSATSGLVYSYTDTSRTLTGAASLSVDFADGAHVAGSHAPGAADLPFARPGQTITTVDQATGPGGAPLTFSGCELMHYAANTADGALPGMYAP
jgi:hypothetical protein